MKRIFASLLLSVGIMAPYASAADAETIKLSCGPSGATYSIQLPEGIAQAGNTCEGSLTIDNRVKIIGQYAFANSQLKSVTFANSVTIIGSSAFSSTPLTSVNIPNSVIEIGQQAFSNTQLTSVLMPNSVTSIGMGAFYKAPLTSVTLPNSITSISRGLFMNTKLTSVTIPNSVTSISSTAFNRTPLASITIPNSVTSIGIGAFAETLLTTVVIPNSVGVIDYFAFADIPTLASISIPDKLLVLDSNVFERDTSLTNITYCGTLKSFPATPVCPPERAAENAAAKIAAAKAADKAAAKMKVIPGGKCTKVATTAIFLEYKYTCNKSGTKLVWSKGVVYVKPAPTPKPNPISKPIPNPTPANPTLVFPPESSASAITRAPLSMVGINTQGFYWNGGMDPAYVTLGPKTGGHPELGAYNMKSGVNFLIDGYTPILAPIDSRFIGFNDRNAHYVIKNDAKSRVEGSLNTPNDDLELCFESTSKDWPGLIYCFYHLGETPLLLGINKAPLCATAKEWPGSMRAEGWQYFTDADYAIQPTAISASCDALLGREVKRGAVIAYAGITGPFSQAPIRMKVPNRAINPTSKKGNPNLHWVQGDVFFYWKCFAPGATFEPGVLAYPWECGGYSLPKEEKNINFKYKK